MTERLFLLPFTSFYNFKLDLNRCLWIDVSSFELIISLGNVAFFNHSKSFNNITIATTKRLHSHMGPSSTFVLTTHVRISSYIYYGLLGVILIDAEQLTAIVRIISQILYSRISVIPTICIYIFTFNLIKVNDEEALPLNN